MGKARVEVEKCQHETAEIKTYPSHWHAHVRKMSGKWLFAGSVAKVWLIFGWI